MRVYYQKTGTFLKEKNFLPSNKSLDNKWEVNLSKFTKLKVGLNWQGNKKRKQLNRVPLPLHPKKIADFQALLHDPNQNQDEDQNEADGP